MKLNLTLICLFPLLVSGVKDTHRGALDTKTKTVEEVPNPYEETEAKEGKVLSWRYTRPPGKVPNVGQYLDTRKLAEVDCWNKATTRTEKTDGYTSAGLVVGMVIKPCEPKLVAEIDGDVIIEKQNPSLPNSMTKHRWVVKRLSVIIITYAEKHKPTYKYFVETDKGKGDIAIPPPNMPQNPPKE